METASCAYSEFYSYVSLNSFYTGSKVPVVKYTRCITSDAKNRAHVDENR